MMEEQSTHRSPIDPPLDTKDVLRVVRTFCALLGDTLSRQELTEQRREDVSSFRSGTRSISTTSWAAEWRTFELTVDCDADTPKESDEVLYRVTMKFMTDSAEDAVTVQSSHLGRAFAAYEMSGPKRRVDRMIRVWEKALEARHFDPETGILRPT